MTGRHANDHDWTPDEIATLTRLWAEGLSGSEIGERMHITKSAVIGKSRRLNLPRRASPIKRRYPKTPAQLAATAAERAARDIAMAQRRAGRKSNPQKGTTPPPVRPVAADIESRKAAYAAAGTNGKACAWPIGHPGEPDFHTCTDKAVIGKPYCTTHCVEAFVPTPKARVQIKQHALYLDPSLLQGRYR